LRDPDLTHAYESARPPEYEPARKLLDALLEGAHARLVAEAKAAMPRAMLQALQTPPEKRTAEQERLAGGGELRLQFAPARIEKAVRDEDRALYAELKKKVEALEKRMPDRPQTWGFYSPATSPARVDVLPMKGFYPLPFEPESLARARPHLLA